MEKIQGSTTQIFSIFQKTLANQIYKEILVYQKKNWSHWACIDIKIPTSAIDIYNSLSRHVLDA